MCSRPSRSLKSTVTALMRFSSVRYLSRSSWILCTATRFLRCSFAFRFSCSNSSYERARKLRSSFDMNLLKCDYRSDIKWGCDGRFAIVRISRSPPSVSLKNLISHIEGIYLASVWGGHSCPPPLILTFVPHFEPSVHKSQLLNSTANAPDKSVRPTQSRRPYNGARRART